MQANRRIGVFFSLPMRSVSKKVMTSLGVRHGMVVYGKDKLDEISLSAPTKVSEIKDSWFKSYGGAEKAALSTCQSPQKGEM